MGRNKKTAQEEGSEDAGSGSDRPTDCGFKKLVGIYTPHRWEKKLIRFHLFVENNEMILKWFVFNFSQERDNKQYVCNEDPKFDCT